MQYLSMVIPLHGYTSPWYERRDRTRRRTALFEKPATDPQAWDPDLATASTTVLSPFLKFGEG